MKGIVKTFGGIHALNGVDLNIYPGEVHVIMGENGAGKSTMMKILSGIYQPSAGEIIVDGPHALSSPETGGSLRYRSFIRSLALSTSHPPENLLVVGCRAKESQPRTGGAGLSGGKSLFHGKGWHR
jgi:ABC-type branched-subunit amino acid transport system ATPase component